MKHKTLLALIIGLLFSISCVTAATVSHSAGQILPGGFQVGSYNFPGILTVSNTIKVAQICDETGANCKNISDGWSSGGVPANTIAAFYSATCPNGWIPADGTSGTPDLRGIFIRGAGTSGQLSMANGTNFSATYGTYQNDSFQSHKHKLVFHTIGVGNRDIANDGHSSGPNDLENSDPDGSYGYPVTDSIYGTPRKGAETRPASYVLTYCMKVAGDSAEDESLFGTSGDNVFLLNTSKNFGIGTTSPSGELEMRRSDGYGIVFGSGTGWPGEINGLSPTGWHDLHLNINSPGVVSLGAGGGNVGIGTTSPGAKLDVNGIIRGDKFYFNYGSPSHLYVNDNGCAAAGGVQIASHNGIELCFVG